MTDRELLARIAASPGQKAGYRQLVLELGLGGGRERRLLLEQLARLTASSRLIKIDREQWGLPRAAARSNSALRDNLMAGRLDLHRDGYGFVRLDRRPKSQHGAADRSRGAEDVFIPPNEIHSAMQGDQVLVEVHPPKPDGRMQGRIVRILERRNPTVVGIFHYAAPDRGHRQNVVIPFDDRMSQPIVIPPGAEIPQDQAATPHRVLGREAVTAAEQRRHAKAPDLTSSEKHASAGQEKHASERQEVSGHDFSRAASQPQYRGALAPEGSPSHTALNQSRLEGLVVDAEITSWPTPTRPPIGRILEVLGSPDDFGVDVEMMIRKHQLPRIFPENVLAEARAVAHLDPAELAGLPHPRESAGGARVGEDDRLELPRRRDFRSLPIVTIDGETARDFDDAVLVRERPHGAGYELQVHIADVAQYVLPDSALDLEARLRGTSVYFPDRAIPMLPQELSTDICSLRPGEDRLVLSCLMELDSTGRIESFEIVEGVIRSAARMTYTQVSAILDGTDTLVQNPEARERIERMKKLAALMNQRREERGSIDFDLPEPVIEFDQHGQMRGVTRAERTWANRLIEEFMLAANECVAVWLEDLGVPSLYRIHEKPDPRRVVQFEELAASFGYSLGLGPLPVRRIQTRGERRESRGQGRNPRQHEVPEDIAVTPRMYQKLTARIEGKPEERILSYLMLRSLSQARYSEINEGHFALAAPTYTHFTSPIRRYPDLIVHRIAKALLRAGIPAHRSVTAARLNSPWSHPSEQSDPRTGVPLVPRTSGPGKGTGVPLDPRTWGPGKGTGVPHPGSARVGAHSPPPTNSGSIPPPIPSPELAQIAEESSLAERRAAEAERELVEWKKVRFMEDKVGDEFAALVLNPTKYGLFVELTDLFVEGLVPIDTLQGDRYTWRENTHEIVGERARHRFRAGDRVQVILDRILVQERKLQFSIVQEIPALTGRRTGKTAATREKRERKEHAAHAPKAKKHPDKRTKHRYRNS